MIQIENGFQLCANGIIFLVLYRIKEETIKEPKNHEQMPPAEA